MHELIVGVWNALSWLELAAIALVPFGCLGYLYLRLNSRCPKCNGKFKKVDEENNLIERITNAMTPRRNWIDPKLPDTSFYRCRDCSFETDSLRTMKEKNRGPRYGPAKSKDTTFK